jgi:hypothetical protein
MTMATEPLDVDVDNAEEVRLEAEKSETYPAPEPYPSNFYTNDLLSSIRYDLFTMRYDLHTIAEFIDTLKFVCELVAYAVAGAMIGWAIGSLLP